MPLKEGERNDSLYIVLDGSFSIVTVPSGDGALDHSAPGRVLGEISLFTDRLASATVVAEEPCLVLGISHDKLAEKMRIWSPSTRGAGKKIEPQDLIYSIGLIDYLNDKLVGTLLQYVYENLAPGGRVILGNFHPRIPAKEFMDFVLEWNLIHRTEADMNRLFEHSPFRRPCTRIQFENEDISLFAECVRD